MGVRVLWEQARRGGGGLGDEVLRLQGSHHLSQLCSAPICAR